MKKINSYFVKLVVLIPLLFLAVGLFQEEIVYADHTVEHCAEQTGSENNEDYFNCVNSIGGEPGGGNSSRFSPIYVGFTTEQCNALAEINIPEGVDEEQAAYLQREAANKKASCLATISTNLDACNEGSYGEDCVKTVPIFERFIQIVNLLAGGVGLYITVIVAMNGVRYAAARDNPQAVAAARTGILNALIALFTFIFMYAFLQWIIPGGIF